MKISDNIEKSLIVITRFNSNQLCFLKPLFSLYTQGCRTTMLKFIPLVIAGLHNTRNGVRYFTEPTPELLELLNFDFSAHPSLLHAVAKLHTGAFIVDKEVIFIAVAEAYSRSKATDIHSESDQKSVPTVSDSFYGSLCAGVYDESDGGGLKCKLKIGSRTMNILTTMSVRVGAEKPVNIGPEVSTTTHFICPKRARIFYRVNEVNKFIEIMRDPWSHTIANSAMTMSSLRQLTSSFGDPSTFYLWRAAHEEFETELTVPTTVFTLCNTLHNQGYGTSGSSVSKLASRFLQSLALCVVFKKPCTDFKVTLKDFNIADQNKVLQTKTNNASISWNTLSFFVCSLTLII